MHMGRGREGGCEAWGVGVGSGSGGGMWEVEVGDGKEDGKEDRGRIIHAS